MKMNFNELMNGLMATHLGTAIPAQCSGHHWTGINQWMIDSMNGFMKMNLNELMNGLMATH